MTPPTETATSPGRLGQLAQQARQARVIESRGRVVQLTGLVIESEGPLAAVGELCRIESARHDGSTLAEVVGFHNHRVQLMPLGRLQGIHPGSEVVALGEPLRVAADDFLLGRVVDGLGRPLDQLGPLACRQRVPVMHAPPHPLQRERIRVPFQTGIKALDTFTTCGRGQRLGIFAGSGVGKSTLLGMMAGRSDADVNVIALVGERGREVREFIERDLDEAGRRKSVIVVATSDEPPLVRLKAAFVAMAMAEHFRDAGRNVLLMMDSVTRFAMAQREIGLAVGEPPATRGYTPSVFSLLPQLLERAGSSAAGTMTAFFTVLVEGDDMNEPVADAVRGILDGHIVLARELAMQNHYPAIDVLGSVSRLTRDLCTPEQLQLAGQAREALALHRQNEDLITLGAYQAGANPALDHAVRLRDPLRGFLRQSVSEGFSAAECWPLLARAMGSGPAAQTVTAKSQ